MENLPCEPPKYERKKIGSVQEGEPSQEFQFLGWEFCCWHLFKAMVGKVRVHDRGFVHADTHQGDGKYVTFSHIRVNTEMATLGFWVTSFNAMP